MLLEPGFIKTELSGKKRHVAARLGAYAERRAREDRGFDAGIGGGIAPDRVAQVVERALRAERPELRQRVGSDANALAFARRFLPDFVFQAGMKRRY